MSKRFSAVKPDLNIVALEEEILEFWKSEDIFHKSVQARAGSPKYVFYEGPPTANGLPGAHHILARVFKDIVCRYKSMQGHLVERKAGWDTHGLPVELEVEKKLGITSKPEIEAYGIDKFNEQCRESVLRYTKEWEDLTRRIGFWVDIDKAYVTYADEYIQSLWWVLRQLWDKDLLYEGHKVVPYCARCGTSLSSHEVAQGYQTVKDPSIFVRFRLKEDEVDFLVWTTTPWTLAGNVALAVHPDVDYVRVKTESDGADLILAEALVSVALPLEEGDEVPVHEIVERFKGSDLVGKRYEPILPFMDGGDEAYRVIAADFVTTEDGTGLVHIAPAYGDDDMKVGRNEGLPLLHPVDLEGRYIPEVTPWAGMFVKDADPHIIIHLREEGKLHKSLQYEHTYPFCWRCDAPLIYYAKASWFIKTTAMRDRLVELNQTINWTPGHIKDGRFGQWLDNLVDWALSRERYWGTPLPIWKCDSCDHMECIGSKQELIDKAKSVPEHFELHRPYVDDVKIACDCGGEMTRVKEVIDAWFDSGAMPVAQWNYPFSNKEVFEANFPADYICEGIDQTRGWFFTLHVLATLVFDSVAYKNVISLGHILDENGEKMSKHKGNVVEPWSVLNKQGADAFRWYLYTMSPPGSPKKFAEEGVTEVLRKFMLTLWNTYSFYVTYSNIDGFDPTEHQLDPNDRPLIDKWLISTRETLVRDVTADLDEYNITSAGRRIAAFVDNLSNWYVRRCRRRFWKSEEDTDKLAAYLTLHETLVTLVKLMAPFTPFFSENIYRNLVGSVESSAPQSVHMTDFPVAAEDLIDSDLEDEMEAVRQIVSLARAARTRSRVKVRQPLSKMWVTLSSSAARRALVRLEDQILEELNVKAVLEMESVEEFLGLRVMPNLAVLGPRMGQKIPMLRAALEGMDPFELRTQLIDGSVEFELDGEKMSFSGDDLLFEEVAHDKFVVEAGSGYSVALSTELSAELKSEGLAREIVHFVQNVRKDAGFQIEDKIIMSVDAIDSTLADVLVVHRDYILGETLTETLVEDGSVVGFAAERSLDGMNLKLTLATE